MLQFTICIIGIMDDDGNLSPSHHARVTNFPTMIVDRLGVKLGIAREGKLATLLRYLNT